MLAFAGVFRAPVAIIGIVMAAGVRAHPAWAILALMALWSGRRDMVAVAGSRQVPIVEAVAAVAGVVGLVALLDGLRVDFMDPSTWAMMRSLLLASFTVVLGLRAWETDPLSIACRAAVQVIVAAIALVIVIQLVAPFDVHLAALVFGAALGEEVAFRVALPLYLSGAFRRRGTSSSGAIVAGMVASQLLFAVSHAITVPISTWELVRLFVVGLLFAEVVSSFGLWSAIALHAATNYLLLVGAGYSTPAPRSVVMLLALAVGLLVTRRDTFGYSWPLFGRVQLQ